MMMRESSPSSFSVFSTSIPFMSFMLRSSRIMSGCRLCASAMPSLPLGASPTKRNSGAAWISWITPFAKQRVVVDDQDGLGFGWVHAFSWCEQG